ncbi:MAG: 2-isopropylmalate synthase [Myxococcales bacterium]|nr:2-isopropylmalate synthase [Myxococcales bacterium]
MSDPNHVYIFDTTLRDGEQSPGATMTRDEKLQIARQLELLGVDIIEAGFPAASQGELASVREVASILERSQIAALCRTREADIEAAWKAIGEAVNPRIHTFIATSAIHLEHKLKLSQAEVLEEIRRGVSHSASLCPTVEFSAEDATRTDLGFLREAFACAIENGAKILNIPDTVGYTMPQEYRRIVSAIKELIGDRDVIISTHCHNDLGLAVANSIAAIEAGARQVECCVNGIGERAGNAALEEVVMALRTRRDLVACTTGLNTKHLYSTSRLVSEITGMQVQPNKAIVGKNAFAHEAGIHQHGVLQYRETYEIMTPSDVGLSESKIVLGKHSGRHALGDRLATLGYNIDKPTLNKVFTAFKALADKKKNIYDEDLHALVADDLLQMPSYYTLEEVEFRSGTAAEPWARVKVSIDGQIHEDQAPGDGAVNAAIQAIKRCVKKPDLSVRDYTLNAVTRGSDAQGRVSITIEDDGRLARGHATHTDVVVASAEAYVSALNHLLYQVEAIRIQGQLMSANG